MPGKVNPVIPEAVNQVAFEVIGNDLAVTIAAEGGQLQLNVMEPLIAYKMFDSMRLLHPRHGHAARALHRRHHRQRKRIAAS